MKLDSFTLLNTLNACHGPAGDEREVAAAIQKLAQPFADECHTDTMGNLIVRKKGSGPRVMIAAHMDSIGLIVTHIDKEGFLRFGKIGGVHPSSLLHTPVRFKNGVRGLVGLDEKTEWKKMTLDDLFIDIGAKDQAEASSMVRLGDTAVFDAPAVTAGSRIISPYLDNRISCVALLLALERLESSPNDLYFVFTAQEELGLRGAKTAAYAIDPQYGLSVDVTVSDDLPGSKHDGSSRCGGGVGIKVMDGSVICHPEMVELLEKLAAREGITAQRDVIRSGGTDAGAIHINRSGVLTGGLSIACRYLHSPVEMVDKADVEACVNLIVQFARERV